MRFDTDQHSKLFCNMTLSRYAAYKFLGFICILGILLSGCRPPASHSDEVVVYTSVDQPFSEPVLKMFEQTTGIEVKAIYDVEAAKTTGLVNRLIAEKEFPQADVFWNSEVIQTIRLQENQILQVYFSPNAEDIPPSYKDAAGFWTGNAARARVLIINSARVDHPELIDSMFDFLDPKWSGNELGIAYPLFGTTATHAAALYELLGQVEAREFFQTLAQREVQVVDGNSVVRDLVSSGILAFGFTDTDDACGAMEKGEPIVINLPDQDGLGTLIIPSTVALIAGGPNPKQGQVLIDYLLSPEIEEFLLQSGFSHIPLHGTIQTSNSCLSGRTIFGMDVDYRQVYEHYDLAQAELRELFIR